MIQYYFAKAVLALYRFSGLCSSACKFQLLIMHCAIAPTLSAPQIPTAAQLWKPISAHCAAAQQEPVLAKRKEWIDCRSETGKAEGLGVLRIGFTA